MAQRRMFSPTIVKSDEFLSMPSSSQLLYFHLGMEADDDGFIQPQKTMRIVGSSGDDLKVLLAKRFLLSFESGVVVIKHWLIHNLIQKDRYHPTRFIEEKKALYTKEDKAYTDNPESVNKMLPEVRLGKVREDRVLEGKTPYSEEDLQTVETDEDGNEVQTRVKTSTAKNMVAIRVADYFNKKSREYTGKPIMGYAYSIVKKLLEGQKLEGAVDKEAFLKELVDEFFDESPSDEKAVNPFTCFSAKKINAKLIS